MSLTFGLSVIAAVLQRVARGGWLGVTRKSKALTDYPNLKAAIKPHLRALRAVGLPVHRPLAHAIIRAHKAPHLLAHTLRFKLSDTWVHSFLFGELAWSMRKETKASR